MSTQILAKRTAAWFAPAMEEALRPILTELRDMRTGMRDMSTDLARVNNRSSSLPGHPIMHVPRDPALPPVAQLPVEFPQTMTALRTLNGNQLTNCLAYYNLPENGTVDEKKARLATHLGALHM
jgi:hypothetical protein